VGSRKIYTSKKFTVISDSRALNQATNRRHSRR
jgi:hypothetical protein